MENKEFLKKVGMELRVARIRKGLTIAEVGKVSKLCPEAIRRMETGTRGSQLITYKRLADALETDIRKFLTFVE